MFVKCKLCHGISTMVSLHNVDCWMKLVKAKILLNIFQRSKSDYLLINRLIVRINTDLSNIGFVFVTSMRYRSCKLQNEALQPSSTKMEHTVCIQFESAYFIGILFLVFKCIHLLSHLWLFNRHTDSAWTLDPASHSLLVCLELQ